MARALPMPIYHWSLKAVIRFGIMGVLAFDDINVAQAWKCYRNMADNLKRPTDFDMMILLSFLWIENDRTPQPSGWKAMQPVYYWKYF